MIWQDVFLLNLLKDGRLSAGEICEHFSVTGASISRHLAILKDAELIRSRREGKFIYYELNTSVLEDVMLWITDLKGASDHEGNLDNAVAFVKDYAKKSGCVIAITGAIDLVSDGEKCYVIRNGRPEMSKITGTGCQLSGMTTAFIVANPDNVLEATAAAVCTMGLAGEIAFANMAETDGNSTYRNRIIDAIYNMDAETLEKGAKYELR